MFARYYGPYGAPLDSDTFTLQVPVINNIDMFPTDKNFIKLQADGPVRDPLRTPAVERVAVGTVLMLQCRDARAVDFEYSITTGTSTLASSGWRSHALNATQCQAFPPSVMLPWEIADNAVIKVSASDASGQVVCPTTERTFLVYDFPGPRSPVCPGRPRPTTVLLIPCSAGNTAIRMLLARHEASTHDAISHGCWL